MAQPGIRNGGASFLTLQLNVFASRIASPGALYVYVSEGLGPFAGIVTGWSLVIAYVFGVSICVTEMAITGVTFLNQIGGVEGNIFSYTIISVFGLGIVWWFAHRDIKLSTRVSLAIEGTTITLVTALIILYFTHKGSLVDHAQTDLKDVTFDQFRLGLVFAFLCFVGYESASALGTEARRPMVMIPRAMLACIAIVGVFFAVAGYGLVSAFHDIGTPLDKETAPLVTLSHFLGVGALGPILTVGIFTSFFACALAMMNGGARVLYALAHRGLFHISARKTHRKNETPHMAVGFVAITGLVISLTLTLSGVPMLDSMNYLGSILTFGFLFAYAMVAIAAPFYLKKRKELKIINILTSIVSVILIAIAMEGSLYPIPDWPSNILPYIFLALLAVGIGHFLYLRRTNPKQLKALEKELLGD